MSEESARVANAHARAETRLVRQRGTLRPFGLVLIGVVVVTAINGHPTPEAHGTGLGVAVAIAVFALALGFAIRDSFTRRSTLVQVAVIAAMGSAGVALVALQPRGATDLAGGAAVWMAVTRLPLVLGLALGATVGVALCIAMALSGGSSASVVATGLLCALLAVTAHLIRQARASQDTTELLLAELEDAREEQLEAAAISERGRIASELHDVLAHALSGAAIQLQGARKLAERQHASAEVRAAIDRAGELVKDGLASARQAVGALRGDDLPGVDQLELLVASYRTDMNADVTLTIEGNSRALPADAGFALYRGAQEALTNVVRYAPGAVIQVVLRYEVDRTMLTVEDTLSVDAPGPEGLRDVGGGRGLLGMRERVARVGGSLSAGPTKSGWRVEMVIPG
jgi:signal transduction histidine kinase